MKNMLKTIAENAKENPKDFTLSVVLITGLFCILFAALWINSNIIQ
jgi:hypothetical protein